PADPVTLSYMLLFFLLPFFFSTAVYFYLWTPDSPASITSAGVKSAPALLLAAVVLSWNGGQSILGVVGGLIFSAIGDCCLIWPELFLHGFFVHLHRYTPYSSSSWARFLYVILVIVGGGSYIYIYPFLQKAPDSDQLTPAVAVYTALITVMAILAIRTHHTATLLGGLTFMVSDLSLALQVFKVMAPTKHGNTIVMVTYYLAQLLIAVGDIQAVENRDDFAKWKRS
uniref:lysoplasmalogenase n=1 Tax=Mastacembelus armatus TaxID=205130 RepID=A0A7N9B0F2_9TELE